MSESAPDHHHPHRTPDCQGPESWDLILTLEGEPGARAHEGNRPLARLLARLPELALRPPASGSGPIWVATP